MINYDEQGENRMDLNGELREGVQDNNFKTLEIVFICFVDVGFEFEGLQNRCAICYLGI